jgi:hypothetical protein
MGDEVMVLKDREKIKKVNRNEECIGFKNCDRYISIAGSCLYKEKKSGRCLIRDDIKVVVAGPAGGIL